MADTVEACTQTRGFGWPEPELAEDRITRVTRQSWRTRMVRELNSGFEYENGLATAAAALCTCILEVVSFVSYLFGSFGQLRTKILARAVSSS